MNDEFISKVEEMVLENTKEELSPQVLKIISLACCAIFLKKPEFAQQKLPDILQELNIYAEEKSVLELSHEYLQNYTEDDHLSRSEAAVTRSLIMSDDFSEISEYRSLLLSLVDGSPLSLVSRVIHEFYHLLRFGGIKNGDKKIRIYDGISVGYFDKESTAITRKHYTLEEGIVQSVTNDSIELLKEYLKTLSFHEHSFERKLQQELNLSDGNYGYEIPVEIIRMLSEDEQFEVLLESTYTEFSIPSSPASYFNSVMNNSSGAFTSMSKHLDRCQWDDEETPFEEIEEHLTQVVVSCKCFLEKSKIYQLKKQKREK